MGKRKHFVAATALVALATVLLYITLRAIYQLPLAASAEAAPIDVMFNAHFVMIAFLFSLIMVFMVYSVVIFRRRPGDEEDGPHVHGHTGLEIIWTVIPVFIVLGFGIYGAVVLNDITSPKPNEMVVKVQAQQWAWAFQYPEQNDIVSAELILPAHRPVRLEMESIDVLHAFWVPEFRVKQDLIPGQVTILRFTPTVPGEYKVRCAEICGLQHATMLAPVRVVDQSGFEAWVEERLARPAFAGLTPEERGVLWSSAEGFGCAACHSIDGTVIVGPSWLGLFGREEQMADGTTIVADEAYLRESILDPKAHTVAGFDPNVMPDNYEERFAEQEAQILAVEGLELEIVADIIAYIQTLQE